MSKRKTTDKVTKPQQQPPWKDQLNLPSVLSKKRGKKKGIKGIDNVPTNPEEPPQQGPWGD
jgi:hypothetical protein